MNCKSDKYIVAGVAAAIFAAVALFFGLGYRYHITFQEQYQLFEWTFPSTAEGSDITVTSSSPDTSWTIHVSEDDIDYGVAYRLLEPGYEVYSKMGIYERELSSFRERAILSPDTESFHNWSSNSRWLVFSSRRDDGQFTRLYFSHIDGDGNASKAFMLPQKNPAEYYGTLFMSYNVPDFITAPLSVDNVRASRLINAEERIPFGVKFIENK